MRFLIPALLLLLLSPALHAQPFGGNSYNGTLYPTTITAATAIANPFLAQQGYLNEPGLSRTSDTTFTYGGAAYATAQVYQNPGTGYYLPAAQYPQYGAGIFTNVWPQQMPYVLYNATAKTFTGTSDCVGFLTRVLSALGDTTAPGNAYLSLQDLVHTSGTAPFAYKGYVATAYGFGVAFPVIPASANGRWQYVSGNVITAPVDSYNHVLRPTVGTYNGVPKGGFAQALAGDILAFAYAPGGSANGHAMVMETAPVLLGIDSLKAYCPTVSASNLNTLLTAYNVYAVPVFDCSGQMAHLRDSRLHVSGIGHGTLLVLTAKATDIPAGYVFSAPSGTGIYPTMLGSSVWAISVGRYRAIGTGMNAFSAEALRVFPNPGYSTVHIDAGAFPGGKAAIIFRDAAGRLVWEQSISTGSIVSIPLEGLPSGKYFITLLQGGKSASCSWVRE